MVKRPAAQKRSYNVYFDESSKKGFDLFTAILVPTSSKKIIERKLRQLMDEINRETFKVVRLAGDERTIDFSSRLEIHAVDLYQSKGIYKIANDVRPGFWKQQHRWIERCLEIAHTYGVTVITHAIFDGDPSDQSEMYTQLAEYVTRPVRYHSVKEKAKNLFRNRYFIGLPVTMYHVDWYLGTMGGQGNLYCHTKHDAHSFSSLDTYRAAQRMGHYQNLNLPVFASCTTEPIIQLADVIGYVLLQLGVSFKESTPMKTEFSQWIQKYIGSHIPRLHAYPSRDFADSVVGVFLETLALNCGGPQDFQKRLRESLPPLIEKVEKGNRHYLDIIMTDEGFKFRN